ncbi:MAG TPA: molybdopterin-dependent oxidoreductase, partial [Fimbriimonadaceae bacterium]|nr:molybdopterin-dependent oxidoreductase [Fimbriimonadaceae bacterium]
PDRSLVEKALENVEFMVVQDIAETGATGYASVVLPMAAPAEQDGTYTNMERRVQTFRQIIPPPGEAKSAWRIFTEVGLRMKPGAPPFSAEDVLDEIRSAIPAWADVDPMEGTVLA